MSNAREEAERRWPSGAEWQASQCGKCDTSTDVSNKAQPVEITSEMVERGVLAVGEYFDFGTAKTTLVVRIALEAALGGAE